MATSKDLVKMVDNGGNSPVVFEKMSDTFVGQVKHLTVGDAIKLNNKVKEEENAGK